MKSSHRFTTFLLVALDLTAPASAGRVACATTTFDQVLGRVCSVGQLDLDLRSATFRGALFDHLCVFDGRGGDILQERVSADISAAAFRATNTVTGFTFH